MKQENRFRMWHIPVLAVLILASLMILRNKEQRQIGRASCRERV